MITSLFESVPSFMIIASCFFIFWMIAFPKVIKWAINFEMGSDPLDYFLTVIIWAYMFLTIATLYKILMNIFHML